MKLKKKFENFVRENALVSSNDKLWVAVSGGIDSVVLLDLLLALKDTFNLQLKVIHVNHQLRGRESDEDEEFVHNLARGYGLECVIQRVDTKKYAREKRHSIEEAARVLRYDFFRDVLRTTAFDKVATGHQADDQAETVLHRLLRGSGLRGLAGIPTTRDRFIRPLLFATRNEIKHYAEEKNLPFREDSSNRSLKYKRNRIRLQLIPYLRENYNPKIVQTLNRLAKVMEQNEQYLRVQAHSAFQTAVKKAEKNKIILDIDKFSLYFIIVRKYILFHALDLLGVERNALNFAKTERIIDLTQTRTKGNRVAITKEIEATIDNNDLILYRRAKRFQQRVQIGKKYEFLEGEVIFSSELLHADGEWKKLPTNKNVELVDCDLLKEPLVLRTAKAGDRFRPLGMQGFKKLSDFFIDEKVPRYLRGRIPILECRSGIVWVGGLRIDDRFKITPRTQRALRLELSSPNRDKNR